jgi:hypothetical protein
MRQVRAYFISHKLGLLHSGQGAIICLSPGENTMSFHRTFLLLLLSTIYAFGQMSTSQVTGTVTDSTGASVPGAHVTLLNEATGVTNAQITNAAGVYVFAALNAGSYTVSVEATGFKKAKKTGEVLAVGTPLNVDVRM